ncbi:MAG: hypothetical protein AB7I50_23005 [Vicinamibacterales bacterium]
MAQVVQANLLPNVQHAEFAYFQSISSRPGSHLAEFQAEPVLAG